MRGPYPAVAVTGGVGCGKSEVGQILRAAGVAVLDADAVVHELLAADRAVQAAVVNLCGPSVRSADGSMDRRAIARQIFENADQRRALEAILHPRVWDRIQAWRSTERTRVGCAALIPLLFEAGLTEGWTEMWCVVASDEIVEKRLLARGWSTAEIALRRGAQWPVGQKSARADCVIENNGSLESLRECVLRYWNHLMERSM